MATPSQKSPQLEAFIKSFMGFDRTACIESNLCVSCNRPALIFTDALSEKEFTISGLCQSCQDEVFAEPTEL
jgi:hypothetical protein